MLKKFSWRVSKKEAGTRLLAFIKNKCEEAPSVKAIKRAIDTKCCTVNGQIELFSSCVLSEKDLVCLSADAFFEEKEKSIPVLYEDDDLLVCNKPSGISSEAAEIRPYFSSWKGGWALVHRLDKETSGALIIAKKAPAKVKLLEGFKQRKIHKAYLALVDGVVTKEEGKIENFLGKVGSYQGQTIYAAVDPKKGQRAITHWKCMKRGKSSSLVWCEPLTGRTHQLRVHLSGIGHPILGDAQYGKHFRSPQHPKRNLLHAYQIRFAHPTTGKELKVTAPIPSDFQEILTLLIP